MYSCSFTYLILSVYFIQVSEHYSLVQSLLYPKFSVFLFFGTLCFFFSLSVQFMYMKAGFPWWSYYIPFYNLYVFFQITLKKGWLFLLTFIPIVGIVFLFYSFYRMGVVFGKNGWFSCLFPIFAIPMIAFQPDVFYEKKENIFAASTNDDYLEKIYHSNHRLLFFYGFFFIISIAIFCSQYISSIYKFFLQWFSFYQ